MNSNQRTTADTFRPVDAPGPMVTVVAKRSCRIGTRGVHEGLVYTLPERDAVEAFERGEVDFCGVRGTRGVVEFRGGSPGLPRG